VKVPGSSNIKIILGIPGSAIYQTATGGLKLKVKLKCIERRRFFFYTFDCYYSS
jgi:hypothetical protein